MKHLRRLIVGAVLAFITIAFLIGSFYVVVFSFEHLLFSTIIAGGGVSYFIGWIVEQGKAL